MPYRPKKPCARTGCPVLIQVGQSYCDKHRKQSYKDIDRDRGTATSRGYNSRWAKYSKLYRKRNPLCVECKRKGQTTLAQLVDHIQPIAGQDDPLFWLANNHQSLCHSCHNSKRATEDKQTWANRKQ